MRSAEPPEDVETTAFPKLLRRRRELAGLSQNGLAERAGRDPGTINRLESGKRAPVNRSLIEGLARALELAASERDELLAAAGHLPEVYARVGLADPDLRLIAELLGDESLDPRERLDLRLAIRIAARRWREVKIADLLGALAEHEPSESEDALADAHTNYDGDALAVEDDEEVAF